MITFLPSEFSLQSLTIEVLSFGFEVIALVRQRNEDYQAPNISTTGLTRLKTLIKRRLVLLVLDFWPF